MKKHTEVNKQGETEIKITTALNIPELYPGQATKAEVRHYQGQYQS